MDDKLRKEAIERVLNGESCREVASALSKPPSTISRWMKKYNDGGLDSLLTTRKGSGRPAGSHKLDRVALLKKISAAPTGKYFWSTSDVEAVAGKNVSRQTILNALEEFGITTLRKLRQSQIWDVKKVDDGGQLSRRARQKQAKILYMTASKVPSNLTHHTGTKEAIICIVGANLETHFRFVRLSGSAIIVDEILRPLLDEKKKHRAVWAWKMPRLFLVVAGDRRMIKQSEIKALHERYPERLTPIRAETKVPDFLLENFPDLASYCNKKQS